jgi:hypothetical protein
MAVPKKSCQKLTQLVLALDRQSKTPPLQPDPKGLVEALADLLLGSLGVASVTTEGGKNEHQDHA